MSEEYEHAGARVIIHGASDVARHGSGSWVITVPQNCTDLCVKKMAQNMPPGTKAVFSGQPDQGGLPFFVMTGTKAQVQQELETHSFPSPPIVETDVPMRTVPEINSHENDAGLLQRDAEGLQGPASWGLDRP